MTIVNNMDEKHIRKYIDDNNIITKDGFINKNLSRTNKHQIVFDFLDTIYGEKLSVNEKLFLFYNNCKQPICECGKKTKFISFTKGYRKYCSAKCRANSSSFKEVVRQTNVNKYGFENPAQSPEVREKIKQTNIHKYGVEHNFQIDGVVEKRKNTFIKKYGFENPMQSPEIQKKVKNTLKNKYGVEHQSQIKEVKERIASRNRKNFYLKLLKTNRLKNIIPLFDEEDFNGVNKYYKFKCDICGNVFESNLDDGKIPRCFTCNPRINRISKLEKEITSFLKSLNIETIIENDKSILNPQEVDIYLPDHNLAIEFNGLYWHSELNGKDRNYHLDKTLKCKEKNIQLLHIFEDEWIEKPEIVKSIIKNKLNIVDVIYYARKCKIKELNSNDVGDFYNNNHLQGCISSKINLGLYYEDSLISCLSFSKSRYDKNYDWEITRFANKLNTSVAGGFARLLKYFRQNYNGSIITYSDLRYFNGDIYKNNGFKYIGQTSPNYFYVNHNSRIDRQNYQKHKLENKLDTFDLNLTEWENMQLNGWDRIWDCGNSKYILTRCES